MAALVCNRRFFRLEGGGWQARRARSDAPYLPRFSTVAGGGIRRIQSG